MPRLRNWSPIRALTVALLLCALAMRVAIPTGYMLAEPGAGWPRLVACPADSPAAMTMSGAMAGHHPMRGHDERHRHDHKAPEHPCAFAAASAAVDLAALLHPVLPVAERTDPAALLHLFVRPGLGLAAPPPPKTGPPAFA